MPRKSTRAAQGAGTTRKRKDGSWEGRYTIGRDPGTGKQKQISVYGKTQGEALKKLQAATASLNDGTYIEPSRMTVKQWLELWQKEYLGDLKPYTLKSYETQIRVHLIPGLGSKKLPALTAPMIQTFYNNLQRGSDDKPGLSPKTIRNIHGVLHRALKQAVGVGYIRVNPADACTLPRVEKPEIVPLDDAAIAAFRNAIKGHKFENVFLVDLFTGMRQGEILGLQWPCVDFERGTIRIERQLQKQKGGIYYLAPIKNNKTRIVVPPPIVMQALKDERRKQIERRMIAGDLWALGDIPNLVFTNDLGLHLALFTVYIEFKRIVESIGIPTARFHDLRHTYATSALRSGNDIKSVQDDLGHHSAAFTMDTYAHVTEEMKRANAARMQAYIDGLGKET